MSKVTVKKVSKPVINIVWSERLSEKEMKNLREKIRQSLKNPDHVLITNYELHWDQIEINKNVACRIVWAEAVDDKEVVKLKEQVEKALADPDYIIITNYPVHWMEINNR